MSLWEKWEREKLEKEGVEAENYGAAKIYDMHPKTDRRRQIRIVLGTIAVCLLLVYAATVFEILSSGRTWSETYIVRLFVERNAQRQSEGRR